MDQKGISVLRQLNKRLGKMVVREKFLENQLSSIQEAIKVHRDRMDKVKQKIQDINGRKISLSEHCIARYIERIEDIPPEQVYGRVVTLQLLQMVDTLGNSGTYPLSCNRGVIVISEGVGVTIKTGEVNSKRISSRNKRSNKNRDHETEES